jgi:hypothetical protein
VSAENVAAAAAIGTFVVITASAIAALIQLRHMSSNNELTALRAAMESWDSDQTQEALRFLNTEFGAKIQDERYRADLDTHGPIDRRTHPELYICDFWDTLGVFVMHGLLREGAFLEMGAEMVVICWDMVWPAVAIMRRKRGDALFIGFEYLADRGRIWTERNPRGSLPRTWKRRRLIDPWVSDSARPMDAT